MSKDEDPFGGVPPYGGRGPSEPSMWPEMVALVLLLILLVWAVWKLSR
jgi:hypothetical protein